MKRARRVSVGRDLSFHFAFPQAAVRAFRESAVSFVVEHPAERDRTELSEATRASLLEDVGG